MLTVKENGRHTEVYIDKEDEKKEAPFPPNAVDIRWSHETNYASKKSTTQLNKNKNIESTDP